MNYVDTASTVMFEVHDGCGVNVLLTSAGWLIIISDFSLGEIQFSGSESYP